MAMAIAATDSAVSAVVAPEFSAAIVVVVNKLSTTEAVVAQNGLSLTLALAGEKSHGRSMQSASSTPRQTIQSTSQHSPTKKLPADLFDEGISVFYTEEDSFRKNIEANEIERDRHKNAQASEASLFQSATNMAPNVRRTLSKMGRAVEQRVPARRFSKLVEITPHSTREEKELRGNKQFPSEETSIDL